MTCLMAFIMRGLANIPTCTSLDNDFYDQGSVTAVFVGHVLDSAGWRQVDTMIPNT